MSVCRSCEGLHSHQVTAVVHEIRLHREGTSPTIVDPDAIGVTLDRIHSWMSCQAHRCHQVAILSAELGLLDEVGVLLLVLGVRRGV